MLIVADACLSSLRDYQGFVSPTKLFTEFSGNGSDVEVRVVLFV